MVPPVQNALGPVIVTTGEGFTVITFDQNVSGVQVPLFKMTFNVLFPEDV